MTVELVPNVGLSQSVLAVDTMRDGWDDMLMVYTEAIWFVCLNCERDTINITGSTGLDH